MSKYPPSLPKHPNLKKVPKILTPMLEPLAISLCSSDSTTTSLKNQQDKANNSVQEFISLETKESVDLPIRHFISNQRKNNLNSSKNTS